MENISSRGPGSGNAPRCIICGMEKAGLDVREDSVIKAIRVFKRYVTRNEKGYRLVVCRECYPKYKTERGRLVRRQVMYLAIGLVLAAMFVLLSPNKLLAVLYAALIILFLYLLSLLNYVPGLALPEQGQGQPARAKPKAIAKRGAAPGKSARKQTT